VAVEWVREATELPVIVKLTPNVTDIVSLARVAEEAGADAVTATNTLSGLAGIDLDTFAPLPTVGGSGIYGGYSGSGLKPVSLRCTSSIAKSVDLPIMGCGGIERWQDAAEYIAVGATVVQLCTAVMWHGFGIVSRLIGGLETYLTQTINLDLEDLRGRALPQIGTFADLDLSTRMVALVDAEGCTGCGICVEACRCGGYQAIALPDETAEVNDKKCDGCGLCVGLCPIDAITMHQRAMIGGKA
jgi:dihydropyrimidine dehydrogenase (NAD+) subunit PreA